MIDFLFVDAQVILATTALLPSVMAVMNLATLYRTVPTRFLSHEHSTIKTDLIQGINIPTPKGTDCTPPIMVPDMGDISVGHYSHCDRSSSFSRHTSHSFSSHHSTSCCPLANGCLHHHSCHDTSGHSHTQSHTHHFSNTHSCHLYRPEPVLL